jgi:hypothetical protein
MEKLQFYVNMPIMLYVPYSTHSCRKIQAMTKKTIKKCKVQLATAKKGQKLPGFHAFNMPAASSQQVKLATTNP